MVSFLDKIKAMKLTEFNFTDFEKKVSASNEDGDRISYLVFKLETPIPEVISSIGDFDPGTGKRVHDIVYDVQEVQCNLEIIEKYQAEFKFEEDKDGNLTKSGSYAGDLFFDLSRNENVWLTDTKLSVNSVAWKKDQRNKRTESIIEKYKKAGRTI